jgi:chromate transport protein ChrA
VIEDLDLRVSSRAHGDNDQRTELRELLGLFLRLDATAFGGPAVHIAMMQDEVVTRRKWLTKERFLDLLGATNLIPGSNSTELAIHIGWQRRRWAGLLVAGLAFIVPSMLITGALGYVYVRFGSVPATAWLMYGAKPVIIGVIAQAIWALAPKAANTMRLRMLGGIAVALAACGANELVVLFGAGGFAVVAERVRDCNGPGGSGGSEAGVQAFIPFLPAAIGGITRAVNLPSLSVAQHGARAIVLSAAVGVDLRRGHICAEIDDAHIVERERETKVNCMPPIGSCRMADSCRPPLFHVRQSPLRTAPAPDFRVATATLSAYTGSYEIFPGYNARIVLQGSDSLTVQTPDGVSVPLTAESDEFFRMDYSDGVLKFQQDSTGAVTSIAYDGERSKLLLKKLLG